MDLVISEVYPAPADGYEWVELCNASEASISLDNYSLQDSVGKRINIPSINLEPNQYIIATASSVLNNSGDTIYLRKGSQVIESMSYDLSTSSLESYIFCKSWVKTLDITPGFKNPLCSTEATGTPAPTNEPKPTQTLPTTTPTLAPLSIRKPSPQVFSAKHAPKSTPTLAPITQRPTAQPIKHHSAGQQQVFFIIALGISLTIAGALYFIYRLIRKIKYNGQLYDS